MENKEELIRLAEQGDVQAQFQLGEHYEEKEKNVPKACYWYERAANQGHVKSQYYLGYSYQHGNTNFPADIEKARYWYGEAAKKGNPGAERGLGNIYRNEDNYIEAIKWYKKAAEKKDAIAMYYLAVLNERKSDENPDADLNLAKKLYEELSEEPYKDKSAMVRLANLYGDEIDVSGIPDKIRKLVEGEKYCKFFDENGEVILYDEIDIFVSYQLGVCYYSFRVNVFDIKSENISDLNKSVKLLDTFIKNSQKYHPNVLAHAKEVREAADKLRKFLINKVVRDSGSDEIVYPFEGNMHDVANIKFLKTTNHSIAGKWEWMTVSYEFFNDDTYSYVNTESGLRANGNYAISGNVITFFNEFFSFSKSEFSLQGDRLTLTIIAPERGSTVTFTRGGIMPNKEELKKMAEQGNVYAQYNLGEYYADVEKNIPEACKWYEKAAVQGHSESQFSLGFYYQFGDEGFPADKEKARQWYVKAAEKGHTRSHVRLGDLCRVEGKWSEAAQWYKKIKNNKYAMYQLALIYEIPKVHFPESDINKAVELYKQLSADGEINHKGAMVRLAHLYFDGQKIPRDTKKGKELIDRCNLFIDGDKVQHYPEIDIYDLWIIGSEYCHGLVNDNNEPTIDDLNKGIAILDVVITDGLKNYPPDRIELVKKARDLAVKRRKSEQGLMAKTSFVDDMINGFRNTCRNEPRTCLDKIVKFEDYIKKSLIATDEGKGTDAEYYAKRALDLLEKGGGCQSCKNILYNVINSAVDVEQNQELDAEKKRALEKRRKEIAKYQDLRRKEEEQRRIHDEYTNALSQMQKLQEKNARGLVELRNLTNEWNQLYRAFVAIAGYKEATDLGSQCKNKYEAWQQKCKKEEARVAKTAGVKRFFWRSIALILEIGSIFALFIGIVGIVTFASIPENNLITFFAFLISIIIINFLIFSSFIFFRVKQKNGLRIFGLILMILWSLFLQWFPTSFASLKSAIATNAR